MGVVTTTRVTHATPAGTYANTAERNWEGDSEMAHVTGGCKDIALQLIEENPDIQVQISPYLHVDVKKIKRLRAISVNPKYDTCT